MDSPRWQRLKHLLGAVRECDSDTSRGIIDRACAGDETLKREANEFLAARVDDSFLQSPFRGAFSELLQQEIEDPIVGSRIGAYEVESVIASGGMGIVYLAHRTNAPFEQEVAIKVIKRGMDSAAIRRRFLLEQQALGGLDHPNISRLIDGGETEDGLNYFVMECVHGSPIDKYCDEQQLSTHQRLNLFREVLAAVQYAHQHLVIHRDIKPSNILVTRDGEPKLLDFGIAKLLTAEGFLRTHITQTGAQPIMTPEYASPEQIRGEPVTTATDVYSLGVVLYELLTGHHPHSRNVDRRGEPGRQSNGTVPEKPSSVFTKSVLMVDEDGTRVPKTTRKTVSAARGVSVDRLRRELSGDVDNILLMALHEDPQRRYTSAEQFSTDIKRHLDGLPVLAHADSVGYRLSKFVKRHKASVCFVAAIMMVLLAGVAGIMWQSRVAATERDKAIAAQRLANTQRDAVERQHNLAQENLRRAIEAEAAMRLSAENAQQVAGFLLNLFEVSDPDEAQGNTVTARELLDRGAARIGEDLEGQPALQASFMHTIGCVYKKLGLYAEAADLLQRALTIRRDTFGELHVEVAETLVALGEALHGIAEYEKAVELYTEALGIQRRVLGERHPDVAASLNGLGEARYAQGDFQEAARLHGEALDLYYDAFGDTHESVGHTLASLANARHAAGQYAQAERLYERALAVFGEIYGEDHSEYVSCLEGLASCFRAMGDLSRAKEILADVLDARLRMYAGDHPRVATAMNRLAITQARLGEFSEAEQLLRQALKIRRARFGRDHDMVASSLNNLAGVLMSQSRDAEAEPLLRESLDIHMRLFGESHIGTIQAMGNLATVLEQLGHLAEAEALSIKVLDVSRAYLGEEHPSTLIGMSNLAAGYVRQGRLQEAEELQRETLAIRRRVLGDDHPRTVHSIINLAGTLCALGDTEEGQTLLHEAAAIAQTVFPPDHFYHVVIAGQRGTCLAQATEYERAEPLLLDAYDQLTSKLGVRHAASMDVLFGLIHLYEDWDKPGETVYYNSLLAEAELPTSPSNPADAP